METIWMMMFFQVDDQENLIFNDKDIVMYQEGNKDTEEVHRNDTTFIHSGHDFNSGDW